RPNKKFRRGRSAGRMRGGSCWGGRGGIALSIIIHQDHARVHNIKPFTFLKATVGLSAPFPEHVVPASIIAGADAHAVPVRLFDFYGLPANVDAPLRSEMGAE